MGSSRPQASLAERTTPPTDIVGLYKRRFVTWQSLKPAALSVACAEATVKKLI
jgi:hypothetical protein